MSGNSVDGNLFLMKEVEAKWLRLVQVDKKGTSSSNKHSLQWCYKEDYVWMQIMSDLETDELQQQNTTMGDACIRKEQETEYTIRQRSQKVHNKTLEKCCLVWWISISAVTILLVRPGVSVTKIKLDQHFVQYDGGSVMVREIFLTYIGTQSSDKWPFKCWELPGYWIWPRSSIYGYGAPILGGGGHLHVTNQKLVPSSVLKWPLQSLDLSPQFELLLFGQSIKYNRRMP